MEVPEILSFRHLLLPVPEYWKNLSLEIIDGEVWKSVPDYDGLYEASSYGRVKSLSRFRKAPNGGLFFNKYYNHQTKLDFG